MDRSVTQTQGPHAARVSVGGIRPEGRRRFGRVDAPRYEAVSVCAIVLVAAALRLPGLLGDGLWRDEANIYVQLSAPSFGEFWHRVITTEWHPPLYFLLIYCWSAIAGTSELALTIIPYVFSVATTALVYLLGKTVASRAAGLVAALLYAVGPAAIVASGEYVYPVITFAATLLTWLVARARTRALTPRRAGAIALAAFAVVGTHYVGLMLVPLLAVWTLAGRSNGRRRIGIAASLIGGALPFVLWLPVFLAQRRIGIPYRSAAALGAKALFTLRTLADFTPVRPEAAALLWLGLTLVAVGVLARARALERDPLALAAISLLGLTACAAQNLTESRYVLPFYGSICVFFGWSIVRLAALAAVAEPAAWRRWNVAAPVLLGALLVGSNAHTTLERSATPKSGIRAIAHSPAADAATLYLIAPDYLASTFAFYERDSGTRFRGFVRWDRPEVFRLERYASDWNAPDAVERTLRSVPDSGRGRSVLDVVVDDRASDAGQIPYGRVFALLRALGARYRLLDRTTHPGRYESVTEYRFALNAM